MIKEAYCSYEVSKLLKEKGFDEPCLSYFWSEENNKEISYMDFPFTNKQLYNDQILRPTHQMAIAWLRTKHIIIVVQPEYFNADGICSYWGVDIWADDNYEKLQDDFPSYEEATEAALKYVLENLI